MHEVGEGCAEKRIAKAFFIGTMDVLAILLYGCGIIFYYDPTSVFFYLVFSVATLCIIGVAWKSVSLYLEGTALLQKERRVIQGEQREKNVAYQKQLAEIQAKKVESKMKEAEALQRLAELKHREESAWIPTIIPRDKYGYAPIVFDQKNWIFHSFGGPEEVEQEDELVVEDTEVIAPIIRYSEIKSKIPPGKQLLGVKPQDGELVFTPWENLKVVWLVGASRSGKSNTIYGKALEAVSGGAKLLIVDQHAHKPDSLTRRLESLSYAFLAPVAVSDEEVLSTIAQYKAEFERRVDGGKYTTKIVLICDEMNRMAKKKHLLEALKDIVDTCGNETLGFDMYGWFLSQKCVGLKWLRDSASTIIVHRLVRIEEALLACNEDRQAAKQLLKYCKGRTYIYGLDFDEPIELQQALYDVPEGEMKGNEGEMKGNEGEILTEQEKIILRLYFEEGQGIAKIAQDVFGVSSGGGYQKATAEINDIIRKHVSHLKGV